MGFYIGGGIIVLFIIIWIVCYNSLVKYQNWVEESWYQIKNQLKRRYDLVPNLVSTVKGYTKHEQETLERVIQLRNQGATSEQSRSEEMETNNQLSQGIRQLFALREDYPELKANQNFLMLQEELTGTENKIAYSRQLYNKTVREYNTKIDSFPSNIVASLHNFQKADMFRVPPQEQENVKVEF
ncbi:LemA family protein [Alkalihalobacillus pseudalcaliphilus]|uniref:LemA family protein n=1 Tax=Alkalihalobacillus pseudalcaliphilus TaxID=79884 RepID=UPI0009FE200E|nr:LemA family protein [Alkalihalobacillus pseudalcaliphilus]